jgi:uncharacterized protein YegP (UPF0339 family)
MSRKAIEVFRAADGWRFRFRAENGEVIAQSEAYQNRADAVATAQLLAAEFQGAPIVDVDTGKAIA